MSAKKNMSIEEILAAARKSDSGQDSPESSPPADSAQPTADQEPTAEKAQPTGQKPASSKPPGAMSVSEMLAAARGEKSADAEKSTAPKTKTTGTKAPPKPASSKTTPSKSSPAGPKDTSSILAAARTSDKRGPMSKAQAAAQQSTTTSAEGKPKATVPPLPSKPEYAMSATAENPAQNRRGFMSSFLGVFMGSYLAVGFTTLGLTNVMWLLGLARFMFPNILIEPPSTFRVGFPDDFGPGQVETKFKAQFGVWIARYEYEGQPQIYALRSVCTHLGCTPNWLEGEQKFKCPCHGSGFYKDGINFEGPAPRPLERYGISLASDGRLVVDKSKLFNEEKGQWQDPASFVPV